MRREKINIYNHLVQSIYEVCMQELGTRKLEFSLTINSHNLLNKLKLFEGKNALNLTLFGLKKIEFQ